MTWLRALLCSLFHRRHHWTRIIGLFGCLPMKPDGMTSYNPGALSSGIYYQQAEVAKHFSPPS
jgi:hypothetical protein